MPVARPPCAFPDGPVQSSPAPGTDPAMMIDLTDAIVVAPAGLSRREKKAVAVLVEEVESRSGRRWEVRETWPAENRPVVVVGPAAALPEQAVRSSRGRRGRKAEGGRVPNPHRTRGPRRGGRRQRRTRGALRRRPAVARAANDPRQGAGSGRMGPRDRPTLPDPRPSARLPAQDQLLRRLGPARSGTATSASWRSSAPTAWN